MRKGRAKSGLLPSSLRIISSCLKTVSSNAGSVASSVRSAGASVAASIAVPAEDEKDQVLWAGFDKLELSPSTFKNVLLLGYSNGFQVLDVEDASNVCELVSKRDGPATFLQMQPTPMMSEATEGFRASHPLLLIVAGDETNGTVVRFYSLKYHSYVHVLRFRSAVYMIRCSPRTVAVALAAQIYCFDAVTLENKFSVLTYPLRGTAGVNIGYGPMAVGPRWLAYASNNPLVPSTGRLSPQNLTPSSSELLPDGSSSPLSPHSNRSGRFPPTGLPSEPDNAGTVVIKDFISKDVISQFRAHTSPISALCFDPSGTLLVTASIHGHNINIFRIMPTRVHNGSISAHYDWTSSHAHLYKLYRGLTTAVIQDISFSHYSQWISIVSSRGTCHIYVISPFGGDASLQPQNIHDGPIPTPNLTSPWWAASCCMIHQQLQQPPPPITYSVVSRIKNASSGWLSTVSNVAASAAGKISVPSGAVAAVFHNSLYHGTPQGPSKANSLEHLLVYSPSGHVIQYKLLPSSFVESCDISSKTIPTSVLQLQDDDLRVNAEPVQWWDVCRRLNWPEREEDISRIFCNNQQTSETVMDSGDSEDNETSCSMSTIGSVPGAESARSERFHWYLSNAEVQINSGKIPIWQKSKICFCVLNPSRASEGFTEDGGEIEIEDLFFDEIEIRRKDLLPVFEQFRCIQSSWIDRVGGRYQTSSSGVFQATDESKPVSFACGSDFGSGTTQSLLDFDETGSCEPVSSPAIEKTIADESGHGSPSIISKGIAALSESKASMTVPIKDSVKDCTQLHSEHTNSYSVKDDSVTDGVSTRSSSRSCSGRLLVDNLMNDKGSDKVQKACSTNTLMEHAESSDSHISVEFAQYFNEGYCQVSELNDCRELTEAVTDADSNSSHCEREKSEEDGDNDDMVGGVFAFSEEG
ncbi:hypothetical protein OPV22_020537 [Ensete ventricosum]|uniref:BCAS3 domain-containing protein n=1 Tax=Ensete ventricosum TaxID=4639 RepID=A0AAV8PAA1_ENSVE|nr:hypothetical protein OPV22_020537 [Ensete ventricosum]